MERMRSRHFEIGAGERQVVIDRRSGSIPRRYVIEARSADGRPVGGTIEVQGSRWLFRSEPVVVPLEAATVVVKGFWDTLFRVAVTPDRHVTVSVR